MDDLDNGTSSEIELENASTSSSILIEYSAKTITHYLKTMPNEWTIQPKTKQVYVKQSEVWNVFGNPSKLNESGTYIVIDGYASCFHCFTTYIKKKDTGTNPLRNHSCFKKYMLEKEDNVGENNMILQTTASSTNSSSPSTFHSTSNTLGKYGVVIKSTKLTFREKLKIKELAIQWLCQSMRPFSIVDDIGLRNVIQQAIGLGAKYGNVDVDLILPHRTAVTEYSKTMADMHRTNLKSILNELQMFKSLTVTPDLWSDKFNTSSYLGITCSMINSAFSFSTFDLAMHKYTEPDKKAENIAVAMDKALSPFDVNLSSTNIMCDRGSNFIKCFKYYNPLHCYAHRLNNVIKKCFFQNGKKRTADTSSPYCTNTTTAFAVSNVPSSSDEDSCDEVDDEYVPSIKLKAKRKTKANNTKTNKSKSTVLVDHMKIDVSEIPIEAREYLIKLKEIKHIIKYVKKAGLNDEIKAMASVSLKQSTSVRWLSLINSLQSLHRAYKATKKVLQKHDRQVYINPNDLQWLIRLLLPLKVITEKVQIGNKPSLHLVLLSTFMLQRILSSTEDLQQFYADFNKEEDKGLNAVDEQVTSEDDELNIEAEPLGISFFRERLSSLFENMFQLDIRHYVAVLLHPKYSHMPNCSKNEITQTYKWIREELKKIIINDAISNPLTLTSTLKKKKRSSLFEMYSNTSITSSTIDDIEDDDDAEQHPYIIGNDELNHYLFLLKNTENELESKDENPLSWWKKYNRHLPKLSLLARQIFSIPATSAAVERQFSSAGLIFNDRRTRLSGENLENIILIRSIENQDKNNIGMLD